MEIYHKTGAGQKKKVLKVDPIILFIDAARSGILSHQTKRGEYI